MQTLTVKLKDRSYPIHIGSGLLRAQSMVEAAIPARDLIVVSNTTVAPLYLATLRAALTGRRIVEVIMPDGEQYKSLETASRIFDVMVTNRLARDAAVVALGGGVVGDMAGFVAACYQRGIGYVQVPTTLLAQVDSSVGGKTAVNHPGGKNLIGAFHQPRSVLIDTDLLRTLPERELCAGLAEVIKYGLICDSAFYDWLDQHMAELRAREPAALARAIHHCCEIKAAFVARDERETGDRALLNLGHTFGHAIETATGYTSWLHGEAVGAGLLMAADMSRRMGFIQARDVERLNTLLQRAGLRSDVPALGAARARELMSADKKVKAGRIRLVLLQQIGKAHVSGDYPDDALTATLENWFGAERRA